MSLPNFNTAILELQLMQSQWATQIQPVLDNPVNDGQLLKSQPLIIGANKINHKLGRKLQGWFVTRQRAAASIYDNQDTNQQPTLTLALNSDANVVVDIYVF